MEKIMKTIMETGIKKLLNQVILGDCIEVMRTIPDSSVDMCFADPPFNLNKKYASYKDKKNVDEYLNWCESWITEMLRITKETGSIFVHNIPKWLTYYSLFLNERAHFKNWISWDAPTSPMGKGLQPNHYGILYYAKDLKKNKFYELRYPHKRCRKCHYLTKDYGGKKSILHPFGPLVSDVWTDIHRVKHNKHRKDHPCQLPIHLLERILLMSTDENDIVFDPFMGTGTTAVASKRLGRNFIGVELDPKYRKQTIDTLDSVQMDKNPSKIGKIGKTWVSFFLGEPITIRDIDWKCIEMNFSIPPERKEVDFQKIRFSRQMFLTTQCSYEVPKKVYENSIKTS